MKKKRFKTKEEMIQDFGAEGWRDEKSGSSFVEDMDNLLGKEYDDEDGCVGGGIQDWMLKEYDYEESEEEESTSDIKIGDRVIAKNSVGCYGVGVSEKGCKGTIVDIVQHNTNGYLVNFDVYIGGHDSKKGCKDGHGWYMGRGEFAILKETSEAKDEDWVVIESAIPMTRIADDDTFTLKPYVEVVLEPLQEPYVFIPKPL